MANCASSGVAELRTAGMEKCSTSPAPNRKPATMKPMMTVTFSEVSTFCTRAARRTPKQFRMVKTATSSEAAICAPPSLTAKAPEPSVYGAFSCFSTGKKWPK